MPRSLPPAILLAGMLACLPARAADAPATPSEDAAAAPQSAAPAATPSDATAPAAPDTAPATAPATEARKLPPVHIEGRRSDIDLRRYSTAAKIIVGREEIEQFGDSTIADVLKRLPGITIGGKPGRGGEIRLRGLGSGYTLILINGERIPQGFSIDTLTPDQVERIEILRAPTAEYGARAIAGIVNIVLREALPKDFDELRAGASFEQGRPNPLATWTRNHTLGERGAYNLTISAFHNDQSDPSLNLASITDLASGAPEQLQEEGALARTRRNGVHLTARIRLPLGERDELVLQPYLMHSVADSVTATELAQPYGLTPSPYAASYTPAETHQTLGRLGAQWQRRLSRDLRLQVNASVGDADNAALSRRTETDGLGQVSRTLDTDTRTLDLSWNNKGKLTWTLPGGQSLVAGWEYEQTHRSQYAETLQDGVPQPGLASLGDDLLVLSRLMALWAQDEWDMGPHWSAHAGLRWEAIDTRSIAATYDAVNHSGVWSPLLHAVWRPDEQSGSQVRASLTRTYRSPQLAQLSGQPVLSVKVNDADAPDKVGNPYLRPELATGVDLAFEHYFSSLSMTSANLFLRHIHDLMRTVTDLEDVAWSSTPRWVAHPVNFGNAMTEGLELEAKLRLSDLRKDAPGVTAHGNLSLFRSAVDGVPGPNNRLDQQPHAAGNLGLDYRFQQPVLTVGGNLTWTPSTIIQTTPVQSSSTSTKVVADAYGAWTVVRGSVLRLSVSNLFPRHYDTGAVIEVPTLDELESTENLAPTHRIVTLRWELTL